MGLLDRAIRNGISKGIGDAVGKAVERAVAPKAESFANRTAQQLDSAAEAAASQETAAASGLEGAFANLERATQNYATEMSKNMKLCPNCETPSTADKVFCPSCGAKLPEATVAEGAVCSQCGKQNPIGTRFCVDCGTKLPATVAEESAAADSDAAVWQRWDELIPQYPKWSCGGSNFNIEKYDESFMFAAKLPSHFAAQSAVEQYRSLARQNGFRPAGENPIHDHLYKMIGSTCYHIDTEHCFDGDDDCPIIWFSIGEPNGGFNYVKPEPKKQTSIFDLFK